MFVGWVKRLCPARNRIAVITDGIDFCDDTMTPNPGTDIDGEVRGYDHPSAPDYGPDTWFDAGADEYHPPPVWSSEL